MSSGINEGRANLLAVQLEATLAGVLIGSAYSLPGIVNFSYAPNLEGGLHKVGIHRMQDGDNYAASHYSGSFEMEYPGGEAFALILSTLLQRSGTSPNYTFTQSHLSQRRSVSVSIHYKPNNQYIVLQGLIVEAMTFTMRLGAIAGVRFEFQAAKVRTDAPIVASITENPLPTASYKSLVQFAGSVAPLSHEAAVMIMNRIRFEQYDSTGAPTRYTSTGLQWNIDVAEWMPDDSGGNRVSSAVATMTERDQQIDLTPDGGKLFRVYVPRAIIRSGTPQVFQSGGIAYRYGSEAQAGDSADWPSITMTI